MSRILVRPTSPAGRIQDAIVRGEQSRQPISFQAPEMPGRIVAGDVYWDRMNLGWTGDGNEPHRNKIMLLAGVVRYGSEETLRNVSESAITIEQEDTYAYVEADWAGTTYPVWKTSNTLPQHDSTYGRYLYYHFKADQLDGNWFAYLYQVFRMGMLEVTMASLGKPWGDEYTFGITQTDTNKIKVWKGKLRRWMDRTYAAADTEVTFTGEGDQWLVWRWSETGGLEIQNTPQNDPPVEFDTNYVYGPIHQVNWTAGKFTLLDGCQDGIINAPIFTIPGA